MSNKYSVIAIIGKSGSGKDTLLNKFFENFSRKNVLHKIISYTTRPPRENEVNGKDYFFVSKEEFAEEIKKRVGECIDREEYANELKDKIFEAVDSYLGIPNTNRLLGIHNEIKNLKEKADKYDELMRIAHSNK